MPRPTKKSDKIEQLLENMRLETISYAIQTLDYIASYDGFAYNDLEVTGGTEILRLIIEDDDGNDIAQYDIKQIDEDDFIEDVVDIFELNNFNFKATLAIIISKYNATAS